MKVCGGGQQLRDGGKYGFKRDGGGGFETQNFLTAAGQENVREDLWEKKRKAAEPEERPKRECHRYLARSHLAQTSWKPIRCWCPKEAESSSYWCTGACLPRIGSWPPRSPFPHQRIGTCTVSVSSRPEPCSCPCPRGQKGPVGMVLRGKPSRMEGRKWRGCCRRRMLWEGGARGARSSRTVCSCPACMGVKYVCVLVCYACVGENVGGELGETRA